MKMLKEIIILICMLPLPSVMANKDNSKEELISNIGPVYRKVLPLNDKVYFLASSGVLYEADSDMKKSIPLFQTVNKTMSGIVSKGDLLFFGDGLHHDKVSFLYAYDIKKKKIRYKTQVKGHIEKYPIIYKDKLIFSAGPAGIHAINLKDGKEIWKIERNGSRRLHVDSTPVIVGTRLYFTSLYENKSLICANIETGKIECEYIMQGSIKNDLILIGNYLVALETEATFENTNRKMPTILNVFSLKENKIIKKINLRGYNLFASHKDDIDINLAMSSGDIIKVEIPSGKIKYLDLFPEPFMSSSFKRNGYDCFFSTMGREVCYNKNNKRIIEKREKFRTSVGDITTIGKKVYIPTRVGYLVL
jgi:hypothetical protein